MLDPISALPRIAAARSALQTPLERHAADAAQTLRLVLGAGTTGELLGRGENGSVYRLALPVTADPSLLTPGKTLVVQVLRAGPPLEVRLLGTLANEGAAGLSGADGDIDPPALRPDQAAILRLALASNDTMVQAAHWHQLALAASRQAATLTPAHGAIAAPATAVSADPAEQVLLLRMLPWHDWPLTLWLERRRWDGGPNRRARRRSGTQLCLSLSLPPWGPLALMLDVLDVQAGLTLLTPNAAAVAPLRAQVGAIAARMGRAGLRLMRCHVRHEPDFTPPTRPLKHGAVGGHDLSLPLALFRAGAEALEALRRGAGPAAAADELTAAQSPVNR